MRRFVSKSLTLFAILLSIAVIITVVDIQFGLGGPLSELPPAVISVAVLIIFLIGAYEIGISDYLSWVRHKRRKKQADQKQNGKK